MPARMTTSTWTPSSRHDGCVGSKLSPSGCHLPHKIRDPHQQTAPEPPPRPVFTHQSMRRSSTLRRPRKIGFLLLQKILVITCMALLIGDWSQVEIRERPGSFCDLCGARFADGGWWEGRWRRISRLPRRRPWKSPSERAGYEVVRTSFFFLK